MFKCLHHIRFISICFVGAHVSFVLFVCIYVYRCQTPFHYQTYVSFTIVTIGALEEQELLTGPKHIRLPPLFCGDRIALSIVLCIVISITVFVCVSFSIAIRFVLRITVSAYPFGIFIMLLQIEHTPPSPQC